MRKRGFGTRTHTLRGGESHCKSRSRRLETTLYVAPPVSYCRAHATDLHCPHTLHKTTAELVIRQDGKAAHLAHYFTIFLNGFHGHSATAHSRPSCQS